MRSYAPLKSGIIGSSRWFLPSWLAEPLSNALSMSRYARWLRANPCPADFINRYALYQHVLDSELNDMPFDYLEFGVYRGDSIRWWATHAKHEQTRFFGFDCFEGLPENWGALKQGTFDTAGSVPSIDDRRVTFVKGLFQESVIPFLSQYVPSDRKVVHLDADLYSSTMYVLVKLMPYLHPGDIILFDEMGSLRAAHHEFRAFEDFVAAFQTCFQAIGIDRSHTQVALKVKSTG